MIWPLPAIVQYLDDYGITLVFVKGDACLQPSRELMPGVLGKVIPHVAARKAELVEFFEATRNVINPDKPRTRAQVMADLMRRATRTEKQCYQLGKSGMSYRIGDSLLKAERDDVEGTRWMCVEGDSEWTKLPIG